LTNRQDASLERLIVGTVRLYGTGVDQYVWESTLQIGQKNWRIALLRSIQFTANTNEMMLSRSRVSIKIEIAALPGKSLIALSMSARG